MISGCETEIVFRVEGMLAERRHGGVTKVSRRVSGKSSFKSDFDESFFTLFRMNQATFLASYNVKFL